MGTSGIQPIVVHAFPFNASPEPPYFLLFFRSKMYSFWRAWLVTRVHCWWTQQAAPFGHNNSSVAWHGSCCCNAVDGCSVDGEKLLSWLLLPGACDWPSGFQGGVAGQFRMPGGFTGNPWCSTMVNKKGKPTIIPGLWFSTYYPNFWTLVARSIFCRRGYNHQPDSKLRM